MYTHTHTCMHACIHTYIHTSMHPCIHASMHPCIHASMHACMHACIHTYIHTYIHTFTRFTMILISHHCIIDTHIFLKEKRVSRRLPVHQSMVDPFSPFPFLSRPVVASGRSSTLAFGESAEYLGLQGLVANPGGTERSHRGSAFRRA